MQQSSVNSVFPNGGVIGLQNQTGGLGAIAGHPFQPQPLMADPVTLNTAGVSLALQNMLGLQRKLTPQGASNFLVGGGPL